MAGILRPKVETVPRVGKPLLKLDGHPLKRP